MNATPPQSRWRAWGRRQLYSFFSSLGNLYLHPLGTLMTVLVLGIAMLLPLSMYVGVENVGRIDLQQERWGTITVFMAQDADEAITTKLAMQVNARSGAAATVVSPGEGMEEFRESSGFGDALDMFEDNPLPWVIHVSPVPRDGLDAAEQAQSMVEWLEDAEFVDSIQLDYKWMQRLASLSELGKAIVTVMSLMFSLAVVVVVANTIRLDVAARSEEIEILSLVGAGNGFIRLPFLYSGFWYGLLGSMLALLFLNISLIYLSGPLEQLLDAYGNRFELSSPGVAQIFGLMLSGGLLGLAGAWVSVQRHIRMLGRGFL